MLRWLYEHHLERVHFGGCEMCGALEHKHQHAVNWLREHAVPEAEHRDKVFRSAVKGGSVEAVEWYCDVFHLRIYLAPRKQFRFE
ncbi:hypothetical protein PHMEG_00033533 [Phytophthora megakarya]|uniref:Uncharacterized protein n=1 Tax=Phytophthora megakarya TaxID=4795 RepID=A0A225UVL2_9STRA|nr:hypothetical protein PHMEG_00033533 [Phytophthora megakarya]